MRMIARIDLEERPGLRPLRRTTTKNLRKIRREVCKRDGGSGRFHVHDQIDAECIEA